MTITLPSVDCPQLQGPSNVPSDAEKPEGGCLRLDFYPCVKCLTEQLGEEVVCFVLQCVLYHPEESGRNMEAGTETGILLASHLGLLSLITPRPPTEGWHHQVDLGPPTQIMIQDNVPQVCSQVSPVRAFSQLRFPLPRQLELCQVDIKLTRAVRYKGAVPASV